MAIDSAQAPNSAEIDADEALRLDILDNAIGEAVFEGWGPATLEEAARGVLGDTAQEVRPGLASLFPNGVADLLTLWSQREDASMREAYRGLNDKPDRIREKITWLVRHRIEGLGEDREAARRAAATLALPPYAEVGGRLAWQTAGEMWLALGDTSTDSNFYTKRATLSTVYLSTLARWFSDEEPFDATWAFLDARIDGVMQFEKVKARARNVLPDMSKVAGAFARWRFPGDKA